MKFLFHTIGCKVNQYETQVMRKKFENLGNETFDYAEIEEFNKLFERSRSSLSVLDEFVIVINSCTVTGESDRKLRQLLRRYRRDYADAIMVLTGCMPQAFPKVAESFLEADIIVGNSSRQDIVKFLDEFLATRNRIVAISAHGEEFEDMAISRFEGRKRAFIKIQDGCDSFCSYCIIPHARGRARSKRLEDLVAEVYALANQGYKELVLVGINLTSYGGEMGLNLADAVGAVCNIDGISRVRLGSLDADMITPPMVERLKEAKGKLCPQFHLSLQSGCDATLKRMRRRYNTSEYYKVCESLRSNFPNCAITTDIMVGFPGETEEEFQTTVDFVKKAGFSDAHVFTYSPRAGTPAARAQNQVSKEIKSKRSKEMMAVVLTLKSRYLERFMGKTVAVLCENAVEGYVEGYSEQYFNVRVETPPNDINLEGAVVDVSIFRCEDGICYGRIEENYHRA